MNRIERAREGAWTAGVLALLLLPVHLFVAPYLRFIEVLCFVGWIFICGVLAIALNDCYKVWWKRSVVEDYGRQHALGVKPRPFVLLLRSAACDRWPPVERQVRSTEYLTSCRGAAPTTWNRLAAGAGAAAAAAEACQAS